MILYLEVFSVPTHRTSYLADIFVADNEIEEYISTFKFDATSHAASHETANRADGAHLQRNMRSVTH